MKHLVELLDKIGAPNLLVIGDVILDRYTTGVVERISPEAPVPVLQVDSDDTQLGGAASVAALLHALVGDDINGQKARDLLARERIDDTHVIVDSRRQTTVKQRLIGKASGRHSYQMLRVDREY